MNQHDLDGDDGFESSFRARSNTWPLPRPEVSSSFISSSNDIPEERTDFRDTSANNLSLTAGSGPGPLGGLGGITEPTVIPTTAHDATSAVGGGDQSGSAGQQAGGGKKNSSRRNAWGNMSYADLITQAIQSSPESRLTLSQIYDWMVQNVVYFKDKGDSNSSAGWKNSIRHNLSLHNRFMRVQNEGTGKSSWWMINPDAKPGKAARRRATSMETQKYEKKRGRVKKKVEALRNGVVLDTTPSPSSSVSEGLDMFPESPIHHAFQLSPDFRPRASSNASSCGRLSPIPAVESDMHDSQVPPLSPMNAWKPDLTRMYNTDVQDQYNTEKLVEMANTMKLGGNAYLKTSPTGESLSPNSPSVTMNANTYTTLSNFNGTAMSTYNNGTGTLHRNGSDPYFQNAGGLENTITLTSLNSAPSTRSPTKLLSGENMGTNNSYGIPNMSPSISPSQSMDTITNSAHNAINSNFHTPKHNSSAHQNQAAIQNGTYSPNGIENHLIMCANLNSKNLASSSSNLTTLTSLGTTATQVMGHLLSLNNPLPNDLDFDSLQGGLECDVDQVISHELSVDGNLDFNFDNLHATSAAPTSVSASMSSATNHPWVH